MPVDKDRAGRGEGMVNGGWVEGGRKRLFGSRARGREGKGMRVFFRVGCLYEVDGMGWDGLGNEGDGG